MHMQDDATRNVRKVAHVVILQVFLQFGAGCALSGPKSATQVVSPASAAAFCLAPVLKEAGERVDAAKPAVEEAKRKLANAETLGIVEITPLISLADLILDVDACVEQVAASEAVRNTR